MTVTQTARCTATVIAATQTAPSTPAKESSSSTAPTPARSRDDRHHDHQQQHEQAPPGGVRSRPDQGERPAGVARSKADGVAELGDHGVLRLLRWFTGPDPLVDLVGDRARSSRPISARRAAGSSRVVA